MAKENEEAETKTKRVGDPELLALNTICRSMETLDAAARHRVMAWINAKYPADKPETD